MSLDPGLPPPQQSALCPPRRAIMMTRTRSQVFLVYSLTPEGNPRLLSAPHPGLGLRHPEGSDRFSQASAWLARPVWASGAGSQGVCACVQAITSSSVPAARGQVVRSIRSPATAFFRQAVLPISTVR